MSCAPKDSHGANRLLQKLQDNPCRSTTTTYLSMYAKLSGLCMSILWTASCSNSASGRRLRTAMRAYNLWFGHWQQKHAMPCLWLKQLWCASMQASKMHLLKSWASCKQQCQEQQGGCGEGPPSFSAVIKEVYVTAELFQCHEAKASGWERWGLSSWRLLGQKVFEINWYISVISRTESFLWFFILFVRMVFLVILQICRIYIFGSTE